MKWRAISAWPCSSALHRAIGGENLHRRAAEGDAEAQFSQGFLLISAMTPGMPMGSGGSSPEGDVGLAHRTDELPVVHMTEI